MFGAVVADLNAVALLVGYTLKLTVWRYGLTIGTIGIYSNHGRRSFKQVVGCVRTQRYSVRRGRCVEQKFSGRVVVGSRYFSTT